MTKYIMDFFNEFSLVKPLRKIPRRTFLIISLLSLPHIFHLIVYKATFWIDSIFHVAYSQAILSKSNYLQWYIDRGFTHYTHEGLGFSFLWHLMPSSSHWYFFAFTQHIISIAAIYYLYNCLNKINKSWWNLFFCFFLASSPYLMFFDSAYMTESIAKSSLIFSIGLFISHIFGKPYPTKYFLILMIVNTLVISQFRLYWGGFIVILTVLALIDIKSLYKSFKSISLYLAISLIILNINPILRYLYTGDYTVYFSGPSKLEKLINTQNIVNIESILESEFNKYSKVDKGILKNNSYSQTLSNPNFSTPFYKYLILKNGKTPKDIDTFIKTTIKKISATNNDFKPKIRMFLDSSGLINLYFNIDDNLCFRQTNDLSCENDKFLTYYSYLNSNHSVNTKFELLKGWFLHPGIWDMMDSRSMIYSRISPYNVDCTGAICRKLENIILLSSQNNVYFYSLFGCVFLVFILFFISFRLGLSLILIVLLNACISAITMLSDPRIMMPAYIIYGVSIPIFVSYIQKYISIIFKKN
jgi:hypothetical protein